MMGVKAAASQILVLSSVLLGIRSFTPRSRPLRNWPILRKHANAKATMSSSVPCSLGVDVGTGSARCGVFSLSGTLLGTASVDIVMTQPGEGKVGEYVEYFQQSSTNIWDSICKATSSAMSKAGVSAEQVVGIGFDATCSLVCLDADDAPVGVDPLAPEDHDRNVIVWLDHRAVEQANRINDLDHAALRTVGGVISPEMEMPKLLWLKENFPDKWLQTQEGEEGAGGASGGAPSSSASPAAARRFAKFFDLADFLVYRATSEPQRSLCTTVCKWNYDALDPSQRKAGWDRSFLGAIGLGELGEAHIGGAVSAVGEPVGDGLSAASAEELGLASGTPVGVGMIDAHAGGLGVLGAVIDTQEEGGGDGGDGGDGGGGAGGDGAGISEVVSAEELEGRMALIAGTSCCHMLSSKEPVFVPGVWGPYYSAMLPGMYLNEGGQSTAGKLLDHVTRSHAAYPELLDYAAGLKKCASPYDALNAFLTEELAPARKLPPRKVGFLTKDLHVTPDFFGNRSPLADPEMAGGVVGLRLSSGLEDLALLYLATVQALAYQTKHIIEACEAAGHPPVTSIFVTGGLVKNPLYLQAHADVTGCPLEIPCEPEAVLLGAAVLGARAGGAFPNVPAAMAAMNRADVAARVLPYHMECSDEECDISVDSFHSSKYHAFRKMVDDQREYRSIMECAMID